MRCFCLLLAATIPSPFGCSALVATRGERLDTFETREQVRATFGAEPASGYEKYEFDEYRTHRKLSDSSRGEGICMAGVMTLGFSEFVSLPRELFWAARQRIEGSTLRFIYDEHGKVISVLVNGRVPPCSGFPRLPDEPPSPKASPERGSQP